MFPITRVQQIEITSECNLACKYCPHPSMQRVKAHMTQSVFEKALSWTAELWHKYPKVPGAYSPEINLAGIGEPTLHPRFNEFVELADIRLPKFLTIVITTNGIKLDEVMVRKLYNVQQKGRDMVVFVSAHRPEKAVPAYELLKMYGIKSQCATPFIDGSIDWAGQVKWPVNAPKRSCAWMPSGQVFIDSMGRIHPCCLSTSTENVIGYILEDDLNTLQTGPYKLCSTCDQRIVYNQ